MDVVVVVVLGERFASLNLLTISCNLSIHFSINNIL